MTASVTLEVLLEGRWQKAVVLEFPDERAGDRGQCFVEYDYAYLDAWLAEARLDTAATPTARCGSTSGRTNRRTPRATCW